MNTGIQEVAMTPIHNASATNDDFPLVTVGIPTYNRPEGLRRTISRMIDQSYQNLEIIISDNASTDPEVGRVIAHFSDIDSRIRSVRQPENIGAGKNFRFLLNAASGTYFMWAADDDEHDSSFIETCVDVFRNGNSNLATVMPEANVVNRTRHTSTPMKIPQFDPGNSTYAGLLAHLSALTPSLVYGLHRREAVQWFSELSDFDWIDCFFTTRNLAQGYRISVARNYVGYSAGIDAAHYSPKPVRPRANAVFSYLPYANATLREIKQCRDLSPRQRAMLWLVVLESTTRNFVHWEKTTRPAQRYVHKLLTLQLIRLARRALEIV